MSSNRATPELLVSRPVKDINDVVRIDELIANVSGCEEIAIAVIDEFLLQVGPQLGEVDAAVTGGDCRAIAETAHKFKGSLAAIYARPAAEVASAIEAAAKRQALDSARSEHAGLRARVDELLWHLQRWREQIGRRSAE